MHKLLEGIPNGWASYSFFLHAGLNSDSDSEGQTTKESHTLKSKVHALPVDNPL